MPSLRAVGVLLVFVVGIVFCTQPAVGMISAQSARPSVPSVQDRNELAEAQESSKEAQQALIFIAEREGIAVDNLIIATDFARAAPLLNRMFQAVTIFDTVKDRSFDLLVDRQSGQMEDRTAIEKAERQAQLSKYGKLEPALYDRLQSMRDEDEITVLIWTLPGSGQRLDEVEQTAQAMLAAKYPEVRAALARGASPLDIADAALSQQINKEYLALIIGYGVAAAITSGCVNAIWY